MLYYLRNKVENMSIKTDKQNIIKTETKINRDIYLFPLIIGFIVIISFSAIIYSSIENYKKTQLSTISTELFNKEKENSKKQVEQIIHRLNMMRNTTENQLKTNIKNRIYEANNIIQNIIKENPHASKKELKKIVSSALAPIRFFDGRGYYLVYDKDTKNSIIHPVKKFVGKDMSTFRDKKGQLLVQLYDKTIEQTGEGYANIYFVKPDGKDNKEHRKMVFVKSIPELNWVIGTGDYYIDVEKQIQKMVLRNINSIRYGKNGYFWIHNIDHILLMHPFRANSIGDYEKNLQDAKGNFINKMAINSALNNKKDGAYIEYFWEKPDNKKIHQKLSYVKYVPEWNWVIGTGVYLDDINELIDNEIKNTNTLVEDLYADILLFGTLFLLFILFLSVRLSKNIKKEFNFYSNALTNANENLEEKVNIKTKELQELNESLQEKVEEEIQKNVGVLTDEQLDKNLNLINDQAQYLSETINTFKDFIKSEKTFEDVILQERIQIAINLIHSAFDNNNIVIDDNFHTIDPIKIRLVKGELTEVIINILNNAKDVLKERNIPNPIIPQEKQTTIFKV